MKYGKLVRDKIPQIILKQGQKPVTHIATAQEYWRQLKSKLLEETQEFNQAESIEELADVLEVIESIIKFKKFNKKDIQLTQRKKAQHKGKFSKRIILDEA